MIEGDIIAAYMVQSDRTFKKRPALILKKLPKYEDYLICGISSNINQCIEGFDSLILESSELFKDTGLKTDSVIRLSYLTFIPIEDINGAIGSIPKELHILLLNRLMIT
jgi:mRNA interferase MazF